jgi:hypothetical protein
MEPITAHDRCDRCGAQAVARTKHTAEALLWCKHHLREHEDPLTPFLVTYQETTTDDFKEFARP